MIRRRLRPFAAGLGAGFVSAGCAYKTPPAPTPPGAVAVPELPRSPSLELAAAAKAARVTCAMIEGDTVALRATLATIAVNRARLYCTDPTPRVRHGLQGKDAIECLELLPICAAVLFVARDAREAKTPACDEPERIAKRAALDARKSEAEARVRQLTDLDERKKCGRKAG